LNEKQKDKKIKKNEYIYKNKRKTNKKKPKKKNA